MNYETHEMTETPPALCSIQMVSTCGTVMSMVYTDSPLRSFSRPVAGSQEACGRVTQGPSQGSIVIVSLLITRAHGDATWGSHELSDYFTTSTPPFSSFAITPATMRSQRAPAKANASP